MELEADVEAYDVAINGMTKEEAEFYSSNADVLATVFGMQPTSHELYFMRMKELIASKFARSVEFKAGDKFMKRPAEIEISVKLDKDLRDIEYGDIFFAYGISFYTGITFTTAPKRGTPVSGYTGPGAYFKDLRDTTEVVRKFRLDVPHGWYIQSARLNEPYFFYPHTTRRFRVYQIYPAFDIQLFSQSLGGSLTIQVPAHHHGFVLPSYGGVESEVPPDVTKVRYIIHVPDNFKDFWSTIGSWTGPPITDEPTARPPIKRWASLELHYPRPVRILFRSSVPLEGMDLKDITGRIYICRPWSYEVLYMMDIVIGNRRWMIIELPEKSNIDKLKSSEDYWKRKRGEELEFMQNLLKDEEFNNKVARGASMYVGKACVQDWLNPVIVVYKDPFTKSLFKSNYKFMFKMCEAEYRLREIKPGISGKYIPVFQGFDDAVFKEEYYFVCMTEDLSLQDRSRKHPEQYRADEWPLVIKFKNEVYDKCDLILAFRLALEERFELSEGLPEDINVMRKRTCTNWKVITRQGCKKGENEFKVYGFYGTNRYYVRAFCKDAKTGKVGVVGEIQPDTPFRKETREVRMRVAE